MDYFKIICFLLLKQHRIDETKLENTLKEAPCLQTPSINEVSFPQDFSSSLRPQFSFEHDSETLGFETGRQSCSSSLTDSGFDDENEDELNLNKEDATHLILGDIQIFSPTQTFVQSMLKSTQLELSDSTLRRPEILESETSPRIQITHARETGLNSGLLLSKAHARRISGCSTLQGSVHEDEEFPMRKDGNEDVIQVIEIPLKPLGRKRGSSLFGTIKKVVSKH
jgi:hypothetical protein